MTVRDGQLISVRARREVILSASAFNAPTIMIGEKASDYILSRKPLKPSAAPVFFVDDWEGCQREGAPERVRPG